MGFSFFFLYFFFAGGLADSRRQRVRYYRQARPSECPKRAGTTAGQRRRQQRQHRRRPSRRCRSRRRRPHLPLSHECFAQRSQANAIRRPKGTDIFFAFPNFIYFFIYFGWRLFMRLNGICARLGRMARSIGDTRRGPLCVLPAAVHAERARLDRHLHSGRHARDPRVRRPGSHQHLHFCS